MRHDSLSAELDAITREFDYGIVPGSATVFVKDEANGIGRLDLTLLEGVMIVLEVTDQGYRVTSCSPLCNVNPALSTAQTVQTYLEQPFESMENLLMTVSPMFRDRFQQELYSKLQSVQQPQPQTTQPNVMNLPHDLIPTSHPQQSPNPPQTSQQQQPSSFNTNNTTQGFDGLNHWIN